MRKVTTDSHLYLMEFYDVYLADNLKSPEIYKHPKFNAQDFDEMMWVNFYLQT